MEPIAAPLKKKSAEEPEPLVVETQALTAESVGTVWSEVLSQLGMLFAKELERAGLPAISAPNALVLSFPAAYNRQREYCSDPVRLDRVHDALRRITGRDWKVRIESVRGENGRVAPPPELKTPAAAAEPHPLFRQAEQVLGAKLIQIDDRFGVPAAPETDDEPAVEEP
jgi:hypothetical protein